MKIIMACLLLLVFVACAMSADVPAKVMIDGKSANIRPSAIVRNGQVFVPLRAGAEALGYHVKWMAEQNAAQVCTDKGCVLIRRKEGLTVNGSIFLPLRKMTESFGAKVTWDGPKKTVHIKKGTQSPSSAAH